MGTQMGMLGGYGFQGQVTTGDGSDKQGKMGAAYDNLRRKKKKQQCKVGREEEGSSSNRPELAAFLLALRGTLTEDWLLYLYGNQSLLKAVNKWIGGGGGQERKKEKKTKRRKRKRAQKGKKRGT